MAGNGNNEANNLLLDGLRDIQRMNLQIKELIRELHAQTTIQAAPPLAPPAAAIRDIQQTQFRINESLRGLRAPTPVQAAPPLAPPAADPVQPVKAIIQDPLQEFNLVHHADTSQEDEINHATVGVGVIINNDNNEIMISNVIVKELDLPTCMHPTPCMLGSNDIVGLVLATDQCLAPVKIGKCKDEVPTRHEFLGDIQEASVTYAWVVYSVSCKEPTQVRQILLEFGDILPAVRPPGLPPEYFTSRTSSFEGEETDAGDI